MPTMQTSMGRTLQADGTGSKKCEDKKELGVFEDHSKGPNWLGYNKWMGKH